MIYRYHSYIPISFMRLLSSDNNGQWTYTMDIIIVSGLETPTYLDV